MMMCGMAQVQVAGVALAVVSSFVLSACGTAGLTKETPPAEKEKVVAERANARWQALVKRDYAAAYGYLSPASRSTLSLEGFKDVAGNLAYREVKINAVKCDEALCDVSLLVTYDHRVMKNVTSPLGEKWILDGGQMWYVWPL